MKARPKRRSILLGLTVAIALLSATPALAQRFGCEDLSVDRPTSNGAIERVDLWRGAQVLDGGQPLTPAILAKSSPRPTIVRGARLAHADFSGLSLANICFEDTDLSDTNWTGVRATRLAFRRSNLTHAKLVGASLRDSLFLDTDLTDATAQRADLSRSGFENSNEDRLDLKEADLTDVWVECDLAPAACVDSSVDARDANLTRFALQKHATSWTVDGARLADTRTRFDQVDMFRAARAVGPVIVVASSPLGDDETARYEAKEWRVLLGAWPAPFKGWDGPAFDCRRARTAVEHHLCDPRNHMFWADQRLKQPYAEAQAMGVVSVSDQRRWLASRSRCLSKDFDRTDQCLEALYLARIDALITAMGPPAWLKPGVTATYVDNDPAFSASFKAGPLYRRLKPVILGSASSRLVIKGLPGRRIDIIDASAAGSHAFCGLYTNGSLALNPKTRAFSGYPDPEDPPQDYVGQPYDLVQLWRDHAEVAGDGVFTQCGNGAGWASMTRLE